MVALWASVAAMTLAAGEPISPRLFVNIVVDGLDADYIDMLRHKFADGGFKFFEDRGVSMTLDYGTELDATAATAMLTTGSAPSVNGIAAETVFDSNTMRWSDTFADSDVLGNFTDTGFSPKALRVSNLTDEICVASGGTNNSYTVALKPGIAITLAGHNASGVLWFDTKTGNWASSTAYDEIPVIVSKRNRTLPLASRLDTMSWGPMMPGEEFPVLPDHLKRFSFRYSFPRDNLDRWGMFTSSPLFNREVTSVAGELLVKQKLGNSNGATDVLNIAYSLKPFNYGKSTDKRLELMDAYMRLDRDLASLFKSINEHVGLHNTVIFLAGTPPSSRRRRDDEQWKIPYGEFSTRRAASLLNVYFIALYGNGEYISGFADGHVYLNHKLIEERKLDARRMRTEAASLLSRMTGVERALTIDDIIEGRTGENAEALRRNTLVSASGDVLVCVAPGFELIDDLNNTVPGMARTGMVQSAVLPLAPAFIYAPSVPQGTIDTPVDARAVAPSVARILRIRSPNAAGTAPLMLKK